MKIQRFDQYINESYLESSRAPLSHSTSIWSALDIINSNRLEPSTAKNSISFSRSPSYTFFDHPVSFVFDAEKLGTKYKITPFDFMQHSARTKANPSRSGSFEYEETINKPVDNLDKYITEIRLNDTIDLSRNSKHNHPKELREMYEDLIQGILTYKEMHPSVKIFFKGKEVDETFLKNELNISEGIYSKMSGTRMYVSKAADEKDFKVYYSTYKPNAADSKEEFMGFLKQHGIEHTKAGGNALKMDKANVEKLKRSLLTIKR